MMSSRHESSNNCSVRRWIESVFIIAVGFMIVFCVTYLRDLEKVLREINDFEALDFVRDSSFVENKSIAALAKPKKRILQENKTNANITKSKEHILQEISEIEDTENRNDENEKKSNSDSISDDDRLNIVLFYADDWTMKVLGKLDPNVKTPNIDKMADNGMLFLNNCVTTSVCWISRATLMTGTYYARHLQARPSTYEMFKTHNWNETLFPKLRNAGYHTGLFGKWHAHEPKAEMKAAFDERILYYGHHWTSEFSGFSNRTMRHVTEINRQHAVEFLEKRPMDKKFALKVSFFATHAQDNTQPSYQPMNWSRMGIYPDDTTDANYQSIVPSKTATEKHWKDMPYFFSEQNAGRLRWKDRWEPNVWQKNIRDLFAMATEVDWAIGEIIEVLKKQGVYNNTLLVFTTDNGDLHGEHGMAEKWYPMEESINVPLVIQDPRMPIKHRGSMNTDWTLNVDLAPTLLGAAGLEPASFMQGRDIAELYLSNETQTGTKGSGNEEKAARTKSQSNIRQYDTKHARRPWRKEWFYEWNMGDPINATGHEQEYFIDAAFAMITNEWKYIYWPQKDYEQLFHRSLDLYDEYDILQNYYLHQIKVKNNVWVEEEERLRMKTFTPTNTTPFGDSVESTKEIYEMMKVKYHKYKNHVQSGGKI